MSVKALSWAFEQPLSGNEKCILLALADETRDDGLWAHGTIAGQERIAHKATVSKRTVIRVLAALEEKGYIVRERRHRDNGTRTSDYIRLNMQGANVARGISGADKVPTVAPEEPEGEPVALSLAPAPARKAVRHRGKAVPSELVDRAEACLLTYNAAAGRNLGAYKSDGTPSEALKRIIARVVEHSDVSAGSLAVAVKNTVSNPPSWVDGDVPEIGDIFGPNAFERALHRSGQKRAPAGRAGRDSVSDLLRKLGD